MKVKRSINDAARQDTAQISATHKGLCAGGAGDVDMNASCEGLQQLYVKHHLFFIDN